MDRLYIDYGDEREWAYGEAAYRIRRIEEATDHLNFITDNLVLIQKMRSRRLNKLVNKMKLDYFPEGLYDGPRQGACGPVADH